MRIAIERSTLAIILVEESQVAYMWEWNFCPLMRTFATNAHFNVKICTYILFINETQVAHMWEYNSKTTDGKLLLLEISKSLKNLKVKIKPLKVVNVHQLNVWEYFREYACAL